MEKIIFLALVLVLTGAGCTYFSKTKNTSDAQVAEVTMPAEKFEPKEEKQNVVIYVANAWVGGVGSMPVIDFTQGTVKKVNDLPVYIDEKSAVQIKESAKLPSCIEGKSAIAVMADLHLEKKTAINSSLPDEVQVTYYSAVIDSLNDVKTYAKECTE